MSTIGDLLSKINLRGTWRLNEPMSDHTTFRIGGMADAMVFPMDAEDIKAVRFVSKEQGIPLFVLGKGANLLVSDRGIRGIVLNLTSLDRWSHDGGVFSAQAGVDVSVASQAGLKNGFSCLEFLNAMPSTVGGAVFMNARCYGSEIADVFLEATVLDESDQQRVVPFHRDQWSYKVSPFQNRDWIIVEARFRATPATAQTVEAVMNANAADREAKGHFRLPCAGSIFKNNHAFGAPSGVLIDRAGLKGLRKGKAAVSHWHGNIFVNEGGASGDDMRALIVEVKNRVADATGCSLEEEVLYIGDWDCARDG